MGDAAIVYYKDIEVNYFRESMKLREMLALGLKVVCNDVGDLERFKDYTYQTGSGHEEVAHQLVSVLRDGGDGREARNGLRPPLPRLEGHRRQAAPQNPPRRGRRPPRVRSMPRQPEASDDRGRRQRSVASRGTSRPTFARLSTWRRPRTGRRFVHFTRRPSAPVATRRDLARPDVQPEVTSLLHRSGA